jgi:hypothetical protein
LIDESELDYADLLGCVRAVQTPVQNSAAEVAH